MRMRSGLCIAGCYTILEAWLNARLTNETRGRAMGIYRMVDSGGSLLAQTLIGFLPPAAYLSYNLLALFCVASLISKVLPTRNTLDFFMFHRCMITGIMIPLPASNHIGCRKCNNYVFSLFR